MFLQMHIFVDIFTPGQIIAGVGEGFHTIIEAISWRSGSWPELSWGHGLGWESSIPKSYAGRSQSSVSRVEYLTCIDAEPIKETEQFILELALLEGEGEYLSNFMTDRKGQEKKQRGSREQAKEFHSGDKKGNNT